MSRNKNDRKVDALTNQVLLKVETVQAGQADIENQANGGLWAAASQKLPRGGERFHAQLNGPNQAVERFPDRRVVVNDENGRRRELGTTFHTAL